MAQAKQGDTVKVHYTGSLEDGTQFDSSVGRDPLEFTLGAGNVIAGFDDAVAGMEVGDNKTVTIPADQAYGSHQDGAVKTFDRSAIPDHIDLHVGIQLQASDPGGQALVLTVTEVTEDTVTLDGNHPLAGQDLTFDLELIEIV